jgi:PmbA protein
VEFDLDKVGKKLDSLANHGIKYATKKLNCDGAKIVTTASRTLRIVAENKDFSLANSLESQGIGIVVHKDQKSGSASVNSSDKKDFEHAIGFAQEMAEYSVPDEALTLAKKTEARPAEQINGIYDAKLAAMELKPIQLIMADVLAKFKARKQLAVERFEINLEVQRHSLFNSMGVVQKEIQTMVQWDYLGMATDDDEVSGMDYDSGFSFRRADLEERLHADVDLFIKKVLLNLKPKKCPRYKGAVILSPRAVEDILLEAVFYHASGHSVMDGKSRWEKSLGKKVVSPLLTITDSPHNLELSGATSYDGDGLPTLEQAIIEKGVLKLHMHDCYSAKRTGNQSNAFSGGPFSLVIKGGSASMKDFISHQKRILYVDRFSGNTDPLTGDFSGVAKTSSLYENGERVGSVAETMIAGNSFELLEKILGLTKKVTNVSGQMLCPEILVDAVSVS